jgi:pimeloyl-ACP methyl ester carboxylesterase
MLEHVATKRVELPGRGLEISLSDWGGSGPLALLSHANGFCAGMWDEVALRLRDSYRVMALDARGHGDSDVPPPPEGYVWDEFVGDLVALAERLVRELGPADGIGHSFGGTVTMVAASQRPDLFRRVAMLDPVLVPPEVSSLPERVVRVNTMAEAALGRRHVWPSREEARESWSGRPFFESWTGRALELYVGCGLRDRDDGQVELKCAGEVEAAVFGNRSLWDLWKVAEKLEVPARLFFAANGHFIRETVDKLASQAKRLDVVDLPTGHLMPMEDPEGVAAALLEFGQAE